MIIWIAYRFWALEMWDHREIQVIEQSMRDSLDSIAQSMQYDAAVISTILAAFSTTMVMGNSLRMQWAIPQIIHSTLVRTADRWHHLWHRAVLEEPHWSPKGRATAIPMFLVSIFVTIVPLAEAFSEHDDIKPLDD